MTKLKIKKVLITGAAGFIGYHISMSLLKNGFYIFGIDNLNNDLYPSEIKRERLNLLKKYCNFKFIKNDISKKNILEKIFKLHKPNIVIHLAASPGVRNSLKLPIFYFNNNVNTFINIIDLARLHKCRLLYASSSSVYNSEFNRFPFSESEKSLCPKSIYGLTKLNNEVIAKIYNDNFNFKSIGLRFFTVYGDYGRPDMAVQLFLESIYQRKIIKLFNKGNYYRSFTYIQDVKDIIAKLIELTKTEFNKINILNIGSTSSYKLTYLISLLEKNTNIKAKIALKKMIKNEPYKTQANMNKAYKYLGKFKTTSLEDGLLKTTNWYKKNI